MTLKELKENAKKILEIPEEVGDFKNESFTCKSGGAPRNIVGVDEVYRNQEFSYHTTANGDAYSGEIVVLCRKTGTLDAKNREIYTTPNGIVFVESYSCGDACSFDYCKLIPPKV
jgi:hypothetical protein